MRHMAHQNGKDGGWNSYYECIDPITSRLVFSVQGRQLEPILLVAVRELAAIDLATVTPKTSRRVGLQKQANEIREKIANLIAAIEGVTVSRDKRGSKSGSKSARAEGTTVSLGKRVAEWDFKLAQVEAEIEKTDEVAEPDWRGLEKLKSFAIDGLAIPETRALIADQIGRLIQRIDVDSEIGGLGLPNSFWPKLAQGASVISDPTPKRRRKPLVILITFRAGGQRFIHRKPGAAIESYRLHEYKENTEPPPPLDLKSLKKYKLPPPSEEALATGRWLESRFPQLKTK